MRPDIIRAFLELRGNRKNLKERRNDEEGKMDSALLACVLLMFASGCGTSEQNKKTGAEGEGSQTSGKLRDVRLMLDWSANTNHTGLYARRSLGIMRKKGLMSRSSSREQAERIRWSHPETCRLASVIRKA